MPKQIDMVKNTHAMFIDMILAQAGRRRRAWRGADRRGSAIDRLSARSGPALRIALESVAHLNEMVRDLLFKT